MKRPVMGKQPVVPQLPEISVRDSIRLKSSRPSSSMRTHAYSRFMQRTAGVSLYDKAFGFANSPSKRFSRIMKQRTSKRRSLEVFRCSSLDQREQYRRLIEQYRSTTTKPAPSLFSNDDKIRTPMKQAKRNLNVSIIDLTNKNETKRDENVDKKAPMLREKLKELDNIIIQHPKPLILTNGAESQTETTLNDSIKRSQILKEFSSPYLSQNFVPDMLKTYNRRVRQRQAQTRAEETRARLWHEKREEKDALLAEILHNKLKLQEKKIIEQPTLPELTSDMSEHINKALVPYPPNQVLSECFNISITREHMSTLFGLNWLNDEIINFYMELIVQRSKDVKDYPAVHSMNTFFYPRLSTQSYTSVRRWTKKVDIFSKDIVLYPIHLGVHWCLAVVDFISKQIRYYDSMGGANRECLEILKNYLLCEHKNKKGSEINLSDWQLLSMSDIPQQMNGSDCGVFACKFAEYITSKSDLTFSQRDMPYFRRAMVWEIINKKLLR
ncbi:sentrin-specific protease 1-like [Styela clava]